MKDKNSPVNRVILIVLLVAFIILIRLFAYQGLRQSQEANKENNPTVVPTVSVMPKIGLTQIPIVEGSIKPGVVAKYVVTASSKKQGVVGYDVIFRIEKIGTGSGTVSLISSKSDNPNFDVFPTLKGDLLILTGAKKISAASVPVSFENEKIAEFGVMAKGNASYKLNLLEKDTKTKARSRMMNQEAHEVSGDSVGFEVSHETNE